MGSWSGNLQHAVLRAIGAMAIAGALLSIVGCRIGPDYSRYEPALPDAWHHQLNEGTFIQCDDLSQWWQRFDDPVLNYLIRNADADNRQLYLAVERIRRARAQREMIRSTALPRLADTTSYRTTKEGAEALATNPTGAARRFNSWNVGLNPSWEIDLFGKIASQADSAEASHQAEIENYRDLLVALHAEIAEAYILVQTLQDRIAVANRNIEIQERSMKIASIKHTAGVVTGLDLHQAELNLARTRAELPLLEQALHQTLNSLDVLLGQTPGTVHDLILVTAMGIPKEPEALPGRLPLNLIRQRPDIRAAERRIAANTAIVGAATAELFPEFSLTGSFGMSASQFATMFNGDSFTYSVGPSIRWAVFESGRIRWNIESQRAETEQSIAEYEQTILQSMREVEDALVGYETESRRSQQLQIAVDAARKATADVDKQYQFGKTDFQNVLNTNTILFQLENDLIITRGQVLLQQVALYKALGGGWRLNKNRRNCDPAIFHQRRLHPLYPEFVAPVKSTESVSLKALKPSSATRRSASQADGTTSRRKFRQPASRR